MRLLSWFPAYLCVYLGVFLTPANGNTPCRTVAHLHTAGAEKYDPRDRAKYEHVELLLSNASDFVFDKPLGKGGYGQTFHAHNATSGEQYAIKFFHPSRRDKIKVIREVVIVQWLCGHRNIVKLPYVIAQAETNFPALVFEYVNNTKYWQLLRSLTPEETQFYIHELVSGVAHAHHKGIVHNDLKPENIMFNNATLTLKIVDWGLSIHHVPDRDEEGIGDNHYLAPEILMGYGRSGYSADMWAVGCVLGSMLLKVERIFRCPGFNNSTAQIEYIMKKMGTQGAREINEKYQIGYDLDRFAPYERVPLATFVPASKLTHATDDALDLLDKLLRYDFRERISAADALQHPYLRDVQDMRRSAR